MQYIQPASHMETLLDLMREAYLHYHRHGGISGCCTCDRYPLVDRLLMKPFEEPTKVLKHNAAGAD